MQHSLIVFEPTNCYGTYSNTEKLKSVQNGLPFTLYCQGDIPQIPIRSQIRDRGSLTLDRICIRCWSLKVIRNNLYSLGAITHEAYFWSEVLRAMWIQVSTHYNKNIHSLKFLINTETSSEILNNRLTSIKSPIMLHKPLLPS